MKKNPSLLISTLVFITMMLMTVSMAFGYDFPMLFTDQLIKQFDITTVEIEYLYSVYSIPNFVVAPLGGLLLVYTGAGLGGSILNGLIVLSTIVLFLGILTSNFTFLLISRMLFGFGGELIVVA